MSPAPPLRQNHVIIRSAHTDQKNDIVLKVRYYQFEPYIRLLTPMKYDS
jgi:hypothetical protein